MEGDAGGRAEEDGGDDGRLTNGSLSGILERGLAAQSRSDPGGGR